MIHCRDNDFSQFGPFVTDLKSRYKIVYLGPAALLLPDNLFSLPRCFSNSSPPLFSVSNWTAAVRLNVTPWKRKSMPWWRDRHRMISIVVRFANDVRRVTATGRLESRLPTENALFSISRLPRDFPISYDDSSRDC